MSSLILPFLVQPAPSSKGTVDDAVAVSGVDGVVGFSTDRGYCIVSGRRVFHLPFPVLGHQVFGAECVYVLCPVAVDGSSGYLLHMLSLESGLFVGDAYPIDSAPDCYFVGAVSGSVVILHSRHSAKLLVVDLARRSMDVFLLADGTSYCDCLLFHFKGPRDVPMRILWALNSAGVLLEYDWKERVVLRSVQLSSCSGEYRLSLGISWKAGKCRLAVHDAYKIIVCDIPDISSNGGAAVVHESITLSNPIKAVAVLPDLSLFTHSQSGSWALYSKSGELVKSVDHVGSTSWLTRGISDLFLVLSSNCGLSSFYQISYLNSSISDHRFISSIQTVRDECDDYPTAMCSVHDEFILIGYRTGRIKMFPLKHLFLRSCQPLHEYTGHKRRITAFLVPALGISNEIETSTVNWFLAGSEDGSVRLWDIHNRSSLQVFNAHTCPIEILSQPDPCSYDLVLKATNEPVAVSAADVRSSLSTRKLRKSSNNVHIRTSTNSLDSLEAHSHTHRLLQTLLRCFYAITSSKTVVALDWDQGRVGWWLSGLADGDSPVNLSCIVPNSLNSPLWMKYSDLTFDDLKLVDGDGHVVVFLVGAKSAAIWLLNRSGGICLAQISSDVKGLLPADAISICEWGFKNSKELTLKSIVHISPFSKFDGQFLVNINLKNLKVCHEKILVELKKEHMDSSYTLDLVRGLAGFLYPWLYDLNVDDAMRKMGAFEPSTNPACLFQTAILLKTRGSRYVHQFSASLESRPSESENAIRMLSLIIILKIFATVEGCEQVSVDIMKFVTKDIYDVAKTQHLEYAVPAVQHIAKYYNDPFPVFRTSCRLIFSSALMRMSLDSLETLFDRWYPFLPSIQVQGRKDMARACVIISAIVLEESKLTKASDQVTILGLSNSARGLSSPSSRGPVKLSPQSEQQLLMSVLSLLVSGTPVESGNSVTSKSIIMHHCIAAEFLGNLWPHWESFLLNLNTGHLISTMAVATKGSNQSHLPLYLFVLRKLWAMAESQKRDIETARRKSETKKNSSNLYYSGRRRGSFGRKRKPFLKDSSSENSGDEASQDQASSKLEETFVITNMQKSQLRSIVPLAQQRLDSLYGEERLPSSRHLVVASRESIIMIVKHNPGLYVMTLCSDLTNAGLRDGDWDRVRNLLKIGVGLVVKLWPRGFFPKYIPFVMESIIRGSLDPNIPFSIREKLSHTVTSIIYDFIRVYPTVSFNAQHQKLAIGTALDNEAVPSSMKEKVFPAGQIIVWDLKTASRVQILDAHCPNNISAIAFSKRAETAERDSDYLLSSYSMDAGCVMFFQHSGFFSALSSTFSSTFSSRASSPASSESTIFSNLAGGGFLKHFRSFKVDKSVNRESSNEIQEVALDWTSERTVTLKRVAPYDSLTFTV